MLNRFNPSTFDIHFFCIAENEFWYQIIHCIVNKRAETSEKRERKKTVNKSKSDRASIVFLNQSKKKGSQLWTSSLSIHLWLPNFRGSKSNLFKKIENLKNINWILNRWFYR